MTASDLSRLSKRQRECLETAVALGSPKEAARVLCIAHHTIRTHLYDGYKRIGARGGMQAAYLLGIERGRADRLGGS